MPKNDKNERIGGAVTICRNLPVMTRFGRRGVAKNCRDPPENDINEGMRRGCYEMSEGGINEGREWGWRELL
jgi:hypothetical protein